MGKFIRFLPLLVALFVLSMCGKPGNFNNSSGNNNDSEGGGNGADSTGDPEITASSVTDFTSDAVAYWDFDTLISEYFTDVSGNNRAIYTTASGGNASYVTSTTGLFGNSLMTPYASGGSSVSFFVAGDHSAADPYWQMGDKNPSKASNLKSISFWVKPHDTFTSGSERTIVSSKSEHDNDGYWISFVNSNTSLAGLKVRLIESNSEQAISANATCGLAAGASWQHFVVSFDFQDMELNFYKNGSLCSTHTITHDPTNSSSQTVLGTADGINLGFEGLIDSVAIWDRVFTASEVQELYDLYGNGSGEEPF